MKIVPRDIPPSVISAAEVLVRAIDATGALPSFDKPIEERAKAVAFVVCAMFDSTAEIEIRDRTEGPDSGRRSYIQVYSEQAMGYVAQLVPEGFCPIHLVENCDCLRDY